MKCKFEGVLMTLATSDDFQRVGLSVMVGDKWCRKTAVVDEVTPAVVGKMASMLFADIVHEQD